MSETRSYGRARGRPRGNALADEDLRPGRELVCSRAGGDALVEEPGLIEHPVSIESTSSALPSRSRPISVSSAGPMAQGERFQIVSNLFELHRKPRFHMYQYHVDFEPDILSKEMRRWMIAEQESVLGEVWEFDGMLLFLPEKLEDRVTCVTSTRKTDGATINISVKFVTEVAPDSSTYLQLYNIIFKKVLGCIDMKSVGRNYFSPSEAISIPQHKLEVWPGFRTSILQYEKSTMLIADISHKILHAESVLGVMYDIYEKHQSRGGSDIRLFRESCEKKLVGQIVITRYNNKTYRIDDIDWNGRPTTKFIKGDGTEMQFQEYYLNVHQLKVTDMNQPLLKSNPKVNDIRRGQEGPLILIPELCSLTGLSEEVRADYNVMKDIAQHTRIEPSTRVRTLEKFIAKIKDNPAAQKHLDDWNLDFAKNLLTLTARQVKREVIHMHGVDLSYDQRNADWSRDMKNRRFIQPVNLDNWVVIVSERDQKLAQALVETLYKICPPAGVTIRPANGITLLNDQTTSYLAALRENVKPNVQMVICILPTNRLDRYNAIKTFTCIENPVPSQVVLARTLSKSNMLMSVASKIAIQLNCKMGGEIWTADVPISNLMVVGIDCYHDSSQKGRSVGAFIASYNKSLTKYYSRCALQSSQQEIMNTLNTFTKDALKYYVQVNGQPPATIIVYRDGVGDGQLDVLCGYEVKQLIESFKSFAPDYNPQFTFIVVKKRINSRFFSKTASGITNPPPGTIIDSDATRPEWIDFFLVSQSVRQGTVAPTHYNIIHDTSKLKIEHQQRLAYKLCHLYYNWPGTIRVPAPCQYAHKLAFLVGQSLHREASSKLYDILYYL